MPNFMVRKNKTAFRPSLDPKGTLSSILTIKLSNDHSSEPNKETLKKAKSATYEYNREHMIFPNSSNFLIFMNRVVMSLSCFDVCAIYFIVLLVIST